MRKILRKIPLIIWAIALSIVSFIIVQKNVLITLTDEQTKLLSGFLTFIGLVFVAINIQKQWKNERIKTEYLNQPDFIIKGFSSNKLEGSGPKLCPNANECKDDHWFDLVQTGNLAARELKVGFLTFDEAKDNVMISSRWFYEERLGKDDDYQYKLPQFEIPINYFDRNNSMCFIVLLDYRSEYSNIRYKRVYKLCSAATSNVQDLKENDWKGRIYFYDSSLALTLDTDSISIKQILLNKWLGFARWSKLKKDYPYKEWILDL